MLQTNTSLRSLKIIRSVKLSTDVTLPLLQKIGQHPKLESVLIECAKLPFASQAQMEQLKSAIIEMAKPGTSLKSLTFEPA